MEDVAAEIASPAGVQVLGACVDVTDPKTIDEALKQTTSALGSVDHLVHAAGTGSGKFGYPFTNLDPNDWYRTLHVNINGMVNIAHALTPAMVERERGSMVFVASVAGQIGSQTDPPYSASKAANINFAQCMARDLAGQGVRVNTVNPGMVKTPLNRAVWESWNAQQPPEEQRSYEDWADEKVRTVVPLGRWQTPRDIADTIVFLSSDRAHNITGQTINVDGGYVMHW
ncbi:MAG: oxidoreductase [Planctomycetaceae bacterium]|nr:oxidoreductase [Planctomycetaceae bacterium]